MIYTGINQLLTSKKQIMKKNIIIISSIIIASISGYIHYDLQKSNHQLSPMQLANIEAIAAGENGEFEYPNGAPYSFTCNIKVSSGIFNSKCGRTVVTCQGGGSGCNPSACPLHH